jgi:hypothetical protein
MHLAGREYVEDRTKRSVCYFWLLGPPSPEAEPGTKSREIGVRDGETVRSILDKAGFRTWRSGLPQVRLVTKNAMCQSPLWEEDDRVERTESFLALHVSPGDIIVVAGKD